MKTTQEMIEIMQAYVNGEKIECKAKENKENDWWNVANPVWDWTGTDYRVKPRNQLLYWAILRKSVGKYITTNPKPHQEFLNVLEGYRNSAKIVSTYHDTFPI